MNIRKNAIVAVSVLSAVGGIGFGYIEYLKAEARSACQSVVDQMNAISALPQNEQMKKIASFNESVVDNCIAKFDAIPFKNAEQQSALKQMERVVAYIPIVKGLAGFASAFSSDAASQQPSPQPVAAVPVSSPAPAIPSPTAPATVSFDSLSPCEQLDSVARSGKSVSEFLVAAARVDDLTKYKSAIASICSWNAEQLQVAERILNPPVIVTAPVVTASGGRSSGSSSAGSSKSAPAWNNCNGIQEPGETYSARCEDAQRENDWIIKNGYLKPLNPLDKRPEWRQPSPPTGDSPRPAEPPYHRGYNAE